MCAWNRKEIVKGEKFNRLTIIEETEPHIYPSGEKRRKVICLCDCGSVKSYMINAVVGGYSKSCGCLNIENLTTHGMNKTRQYQTWADMKTRCDNTNHKWYSEYGGRGISYDPKWSTFKGFWEDMEEGYSDNLTLDRIDVDGDYRKENCRWVIAAIQSHNQRKSKNSKNIYIGVSVDEKNGYIGARIKKQGRNLHLGQFDNQQDAAKAYDDASELIYGDRPNNTPADEDWIYENVCVRLDANEKGISMRPKGEDNSSAKLTDEQVLEIYTLAHEGKLIQKEIAEIFGVKQSAVSSIKRGVSWGHLTKDFKIDP